MSLIDFLFGQHAVLYDRSTRDKVYLGIVLSEEQSRSADLTVYPIEGGRGVSVSDHLQPVPDTFSLEFILTDKQAGSFEALWNNKSVEAKILQLDWWMRDGIRLVYSGPAMSKFTQRVYQITGDNLVITQCDVLRSLEEGTSVKMSATLSKVHIVYAMMANIKLPQAAKQAASKGTGTTTPAVVEPEPWTAIFNEMPFGIG